MQYVVLDLGLDLETDLPSLKVVPADDPLLAEFKMCVLGEYATEESAIVALECRSRNV